MSRDVYQPCPLCTDKKIKFCCADIADEMAMIMRQLESGQRRTALKRLEKLGETHPDTVWNQLTRAMVLLEDGQREQEILEILTRLHEKEPDHVGVMALYAATLLQTSGYEQAREWLWRALRKTQEPSELFAGLLTTFAEILGGSGRFLAARQHQVLAMRFAPQVLKHEIFTSLMELDGSRTIPYPLRGVHSLRPVEGDGERKEAGRKAARLAERGCFGPAAERFAALVEKTPDDAALVYNMALCRAWAGDESLAAEGFVRAAGIEKDFETAAEYAVIGLMLQTLVDDSTIHRKQVLYRISSASRVLTLLDDQPRLVRQQIPQQEGISDGIAGYYDLAHCPVPDFSEEVGFSEIPKLIGRIVVVQSSAETDGSPLLQVVCESEEDHENAFNLLRELLGSEMQEPAVETHDVTVGAIPPDFHALHSEPVFPSSLSLTERARLTRDFMVESVEQWLSQPQELLGGQTLEDAAGNQEHHVTIAGMLYLLDAAIFHQRLDIDLNDYRKRLGLPEIARIQPTEDQSLHSFSTIQMHRLAIEDLNDRQLSIVMNRSLMIDHWPFLRATLMESLQRDIPDLDKNRIYGALFRLAHYRGDTDDALHWISEARSYVASGEDAFTEIVQWDLREVAIRVDLGDTPELREYLRKVTSYYSRKLPNFLDFVQMHLEARNINIPLSGDGKIAGAESQGLWTPDQPSESGKSLWLPGS